MYTTIGGAGNPKSSEWYSVVPQIWPGTAVPNGQNVVVRQPNPVPSAATTAPLWYTYSYPDASVTGHPVAYFWGTVGMSGASKRNYSASVSTSASFKAAFSGDSITWVYTTNASCGIANVTIDGVSKGTVDQYSASPVYKATSSWSGLGSGNHTIVITNSATRNPLSKNTFITHDAFLANGVNDPSDPTPVLENNYDGETTYQWGKVPNALASDYDYSANVSTSAACALEFTGSDITWKYTTNASCGIANVYIDGTFEGQVNQYSASPAYQVSTSYSGLGNSPHVIFIQNSTTRDPLSKNTFLTVDAFVVGSTTYEN